ncbi:DDE-type integrase/transposase/recombinase, partial [Candidatus Uhrbacteria bacterium]|nr:DDE-type integrase/transposase/recombinase [Candidatus Uhrbacteria bacterium]
IQIDCVEHCGQSADGTFLYTVSVTDTGSGWWEGEPAMGKSATAIILAIGRIRHRFPFLWKEIHTDNGSEFINASVWKYAKNNRLDFSRSRPYAKNDNCFVEQKNSTHVRRIIGYHRYDTKEEYEIVKNLYGTELRLYKNFFQPIIPLVSKERIGGHIRRKYGEPKTPYQRIMEDKTVSQEIKKNLTSQYDLLNPAQLKRRIKTKTRSSKHKGRTFQKTHTSFIHILNCRADDGSARNLNCLTRRPVQIMINDTAKTILCYGDSNTWGAVPLSANNDRYSRSIRWPGALQRILGEDYDVINAGLCGRTLVAHDLEKPWRTGISHVEALVVTADPCYLVIIMLGTNDMKTTYGLNPNDIAIHLEQTILAIKNERLHLRVSPQILIVCPPIPVEPTQEKIDERLTRWPEFFEVLPQSFKAVAEKYDCRFLNAGDHVLSSSIDGYHLDPEAHLKFAKVIGREVLEMNL